MTTLQLNSTANPELKQLARILSRRASSRNRRLAALALIAAAVIVTTACSSAMMLLGTGAKRPAASEFGLGPRTSANGLYLATLEPSRAIRPRQMQTVRVSLTDRNGRSIIGASMTIDGGMPQHGHGLPTRPRMTNALDGGVYEIEGVRFNMGGWWEFKVTISSERGTDTVTFNLSV